MTQSIADRTKRLVDVAMGRVPADRVIRSGRWVSVQSGEIVPGTDLAMTADRIAYIGPDASHTIGPDTQVVDARDRYLVPGLLDGHMHVESGMVTVTEFVRAVLGQGTTGMFIDPHEIANVFGLKGVRLMVDEAAEQPIHVWVQMPSCVPSAPGLETPGAAIGPAEVAEAMQWPGIIGLGEMMNFPGVYHNDEKMHAEMAEAVAAGTVEGGHYASLDLGNPFHAYAAAGPNDDHEGTRMEDAIARVRQGLKVMLRLGSAWYDVASQIRAVTEAGLDPRHFILCTDDSHSETLINEGHMNRVVRHAIEQGVSPIVALQMATLNTAEHFGVSDQVGQLAPGRFADVLIVSDLAKMTIDSVYARGKHASEQGQLLIKFPNFDYPDWAKHSVNVGRELTAEDFRMPGPGDGHYSANVIGLIENQAPTRRLKFDIEISDGDFTADLVRDVIKVALIERHAGSGRMQLGLVHGFGLGDMCAIGTTVAHDSHHMIVAGTDERQMALAANRLAEVQGGQLVMQDGETIGLVELPIAGLMSNDRAENVAAAAAKVLSAYRTCGCTLNNPNILLAFLGLVVIPELRISDLGLVDVNAFDFVPLFNGPA